MSSSDISHQLRQAGLRVTAPRESVLQWLAEHLHATAEQVRCGVVQRLGSVSTQAVYDVLAACTSAGLVRRIEPAGHPARTATSSTRRRCCSGERAPVAKIRPRPLNQQSPTKTTIRRHYSDRRAAQADDDGCRDPGRE